MAAPPTIEFLHTAEVHVATFEHLLADRASEVRLRHEVRADWLERARNEGLSRPLDDAVATHLRAAAERADVVVCTCSTLGPVADRIGDEGRAVFRIDRPMMEAAAGEPGTCVVAVCLQSTITPTTDLYERVCRTNAADSRHTIANCMSAWPHFEAGDPDRFAATIADSVRKALAGTPDAGCVVLAQASMACAETLLSDLRVPVFSSPRMAAREAIRRACPSDTRAKS